MFLRCTLPLFFALSACSAVAQTAPPQPTAAPKPEKHKVFIRSGEVITCHPGEDCAEEVIDGHRYYVLNVDGYTVKASIDVAPHNSYADVTIVNGTPSKLKLIPAEFRIEIIKPQFQRLSYVDPKKPAAKAKETRSKGLPPPSYFTSEKHLKDKQKEAALAPVPQLVAKTLAPDETVSGRVYFQHPGKATEMSLVLPISGALFEFPYTAAQARAPEANRSTPAVELQAR